MYCGISISNSLLFKRVQDAQYRSKLASDLMIYHMQVQLTYLVANDIIIAIVRALEYVHIMQVQLLHYLLLLLPLFLIKRKVLPTFITIEAPE